MQKNKKQYRKVNTSQSSMYWSLVGIAILFLFTFSFIKPTIPNKGIDAINNTIALSIPRFSETPFKLGLDLQGGAHLVYKTDVTSIAESDQAGAVEGARDVIERRVNALGVGESDIRTTKVGDEYRIDIEMPGVTNVEEAIARIGDTPILEFKEQNTEPPRVLTAEEKQSVVTYNAQAKKKSTAALQSVLKRGADFAAIASTVSEDPTGQSNGGDTGFVTKDQIDPALYKTLSTLKDGQISSTVLDTTHAYYVVKRTAARDGATYATVSHILICSKDIAGCTSGLSDAEAKVEADTVFGLATASNFADLAKERSNDPTTAADGGKIGEIKQGTVPIPELDTAIFAADDNQIIGPIKTEMGYHVVYVQDKYVSAEYQAQLIAIAKQTEEDLLPPQDPWKFTGLSGKQLSRAEVTTDPQTGSVMVSLKFNEEGTQLFAEITKKNLQKPVAIFLDSELLSQPTVQSEITNGEAVITGNFSIAEAQLLAQRLNAGALPVPVELISQETIGASLGADSLARSLHAGLLGMIVVMICMILYYRLPGVLASVSLLIYLTLTLAVFKLIGVTMSLSGIAGIILSIGMAVDANVLIFERTKEELRNGRTLLHAIEEGFVRAWSSIRDSNVSSLISAVLMIWFGSSFVKGFATTLALGVLISMFTAITVTRLFLRIAAPIVAKRAPWLFLGYTKQAE